MSDPKRFRDRKFCAVLYPDDPTHSEAIERLMNGGYNFAAILHDEDTYEDGEHVGEKKKPHWHVVVKFVNAVWNEPLAKELGIESNYLENCKSLDGALCYLVHAGYDDKFQYDIEMVFGPLKSRLAFLLADNDESTRVLTIYDIIRNSPGYVTYTEIFEKVCRAGLYGDFRRMGTGAMYLIQDHNRQYLDEDMVRCRFDRDRFNEYEKH